MTNSGKIIVVRPRIHSLAVSGTSGMTKMRGPIKLLPSDRRATVNSWAKKDRQRSCPSVSLLRMQHSIIGRIFIACRVNNQNLTLVRSVIAAFDHIKEATEHLLSRKILKFEADAISLEIYDLSTARNAFSMWCQILINAVRTEITSGNTCHLAVLYYVCCPHSGL